MDFLGPLSQSDFYNYILIIINQLIKIIYFISIIIKVLILEIAKLFIDNVYRLYKILELIVNNRNIRFTSKF